MLSSKWKPHRHQYTYIQSREENKDWYGKMLTEIHSTHDQFRISHAYWDSKQTTKEIKLNSTVKNNNHNEIVIRLTVSFVTFSIYWNLSTLKEDEEEGKKCTHIFIFWNIDFSNFNDERVTIFWCVQFSILCRRLFLQFFSLIA